MGSSMSSMVFRVLIALLGLINIILGLNVALGGLATAGWLGPTDFLQVANEQAYLVQDSHMRFYGGLYTGVGLFLLLASTNLRKYQAALNLVFALIFMGGLARFTMMRPDIIFGPKIIVSLAVELLLMPVFYLWLMKIAR